MKQSIIGLLLSIISPFILSAQVNIHDSAIFIPMVYATYSYQIPGGDLARQFGNNSSIGGGFMFKTASNWVFGVEGNFMFGGMVKNQDSLLRPISSPEGLIIDANGYFADVIFYERGYNFTGKFGKMIPLLARNPNSGFLLMAGGGFLQDKIRIHVPGNTAPQLVGDYKKGYDRLNNGFVLAASLGYAYLGNTRLLNFYLGFEFMQTWTKMKRDYDFNTGKPDNSNLSSQFYGLKVKWIIPLYGRAPQEYYVY